ncbi:MAG TPA: DUF4430 domain-containing protein [Candidatus Norongarragalinales archaeon]|nr:DUF4430 domain-containing protein [Candidatus Norongarragalinales archaeon]
MKNSVSFLIIFIASALLFGCLSQQNPGPAVSIATIEPANPATEQITIILTVNNGISKSSKAITAGRGISALEAFQKVAEIGYKEYPFGSYVYSVNGLAENTGNSGKYWQYYVDGRIVMVAIDKYILSSDAELEFRYEGQNPEIK